MQKIVFATNNKHKLKEIREILGSKFEVVSLSEIGCHEDIPETGKTLEENARQKAQYVFEHYGYSCFADDTGLEVEALGGEPGIYSARYASLDGTGAASHDSEANMNKLLAKLEGQTNRKARFRTAIALIEVPADKASADSQDTPCTMQLFEGIITGHIATEKSGCEGFGYDPIFVPDGYDKSFAELGEDIKNHISHRARAVQKLAEYLTK